MQKKVCCFGELLLRLSPGANNDWLDNNSMPFFIGGAELNTAVALGNWDIPVTYITALPENYVSGQIMEHLIKKGIDTSKILVAGDKIGIYFLPVGSELKNQGVIYDRANSSFSGIKPGMIDWKRTFEDCSWFHFSAISPAINENLAAVCKEALDAATGLGLTISVDLNHRSKLWQYGKTASEIMPDLVKHCTIIMGNIWSVEKLLGVPSPINSSEGKSKQQLIHATDESMLELRKLYPEATTLAYTFRLEKSYWAALKHGESTTISKIFELKNMIDKVGSGDCFMAGLIYGLYNKHQPKDIVAYSTAAAVGKLQEAGDVTWQTIESVQKKITSVYR